MRPISEPFILDDFGKINHYIPDTTTTSTVRLMRKYPKSFHVATMESHTISGQIEAANKPDFSDADTLFVFKTLDYPNLIPIDTIDKYRYWRFFQSDSTRICTLAELQFLNGEKTLKGEPICHADDLWQIDDTKKLVDDDWLTNYYSDRKPDGWIAVHFL